MNSKENILAVAVVLLAALGVAVAWQNAWTQAIDAAALKAAVAARTPGLTVFMKSASFLGTGLVYLAVLGAGIAGYKHGGWKPLAIAVVSLALAQIVRLLINLAVQRPRPPQEYWLVHANWFSFPSGHTVATAVGFGLVAWLIWMTSRQAGVAAAIVAVVLALLVGTSRVYLGVHWVSDIAGSLAFAVAWLMLTLIVAGRIIGA